MNTALRIAANSNAQLPIWVNHEGYATSAYFRLSPRAVPIADMALPTLGASSGREQVQQNTPCGTLPSRLLDHLVSEIVQLRRNCKAKGVCSLAIDPQAQV